MSNISLLTPADCKTGLLAAFGKEACGKFRGLPKGFVFTTPDFSFNVGLDNTDGIEDKEDVLTFLNDNVSFASLDTSDPGYRQPNIPRVLPYYPSVVNLEPSGGEPNIIQEGFGSGIPNGLTAYSEIYTIVDGGECMLKQLAKLKEQQLRVFIIDEQNILYGTMDDKSNVKGYLCMFSVVPRANTGAQTPAILLHVIYDRIYEQERYREVAISLGEELETLHEVTIQPYSKLENAFRVVSSCSGKSITEYSQAMAQAFVDNFRVFLYDGVPLAQAPTYNILEKAFVLTSPDIDVALLSINEDMYNVPTETDVAQSLSTRFLLGNN